MYVHVYTRNPPPVQLVRQVLMEVGGDLCVIYIYALVRQVFVQCVYIHVYKYMHEQSLNVENTTSAQKKEIEKEKKKERRHL